MRSALAALRAWLLGTEIRAESADLIYGPRFTSRSPKNRHALLMAYGRTCAPADRCQCGLIGIPWVPTDAVLSQYDANLCRISPVMHVRSGQRRPCQPIAEYI